MEYIAKGKRIMGTDRTRLAADLAKRYDKGASIRSLAEGIGRSYGFVHRVLNETDVILRERSGSDRKRIAHK